MPLQETSGAASYDAFGGGVAAVPNYIEDVFSTYLYSGNGATQTITNGIDLSTKGGLVWGKSRTNAADHFLTDTVRGNTHPLISNSTAGQYTSSATVTGFNTTGFGLGAGDIIGCNNSGQNYASWTFRKQPKFFDVVTGTVDSSGNILMSHSLGSVPGAVFLKDSSAAGNWWVYHRSYGATDQYQFLNLTNAQNTFAGGQNWTVTSTQVGLGGPGGIFTTGDTFVAYIFAHNAGGFGLTGTDNVITCGSFTTDGSGNATVNLGYEPQWILRKNSGSTGDWIFTDNMRGLPVGTGDAQLYANTSGAEATFTAYAGIEPTATGFNYSVAPQTSTTFIYIAIRRGPMKVPTDATKVFAPVAQAGASFVTTNFPVDGLFTMRRSAAQAEYTADRLRGGGNYLFTTSTAAEDVNATPYINFAYNNGINDTLFNSDSRVYWNFRRAPSFFDEVCYTGTGSATTQTHNLGVIPELMIVKGRSDTGGTNWSTYCQYVNGGVTPEQYYLRLNTTNAIAASSAVWNNTAPTSSVFSIGTAVGLNSSGQTFVSYLFATCAGVSKVGSYTGNGSTQTINCGFTGGARFVLIKRTDSTGDWYVYDTARGMTTLTDPYLLLDSTAPESATLGSVTTVSTGFAVNASILAAINTNAASYIFLAIA